MVGSRLLARLLLPIQNERGLFGISFKKMFKNPFGKHSLFGKATQIASILPIPGAGLVGKAFSLLNRGKSTYDRLRGMAAPILTAAGAHRFVPGDAREGVMPGGARVGAARPRAARRSSRKRAARPRSRARKLKFGSPAWRKKYMRRRSA